MQIKKLAGGFAVAVYIAVAMVWGPKEVSAATPVVMTGDACSDAMASENWAMSGFQYAYDDYQTSTDVLMVGLNIGTINVGDQNYNYLTTVISQDQISMSYMNSIIDQDEQIRRDNGCPF